MIKTLSILTAAAMLICGGVGVANAGSDAASLTAVPDAVIDFENVIPGELTVIEGITPTVIGEQGVTAAK